MIAVGVGLGLAFISLSERGFSTAVAGGDFERADKWAHAVFFWAEWGPVLALAIFVCLLALQAGGDP